MSEQIPIAVTDQIVRQQERINELENAIVNIHRWTGSKRCARECKRVIPDVSTRAAAMPNAEAHRSALAETVERKGNDEKSK